MATALTFEGNPFVQVGFHGRNRGGLDINNFIRTRGVLDNTVSPTTLETLYDEQGTVILSSKASTVTLPAPRKGLLRRVVAGLTASTAARLCVLASGSFLSTAGSTHNRFTLNGKGQTIEYVGLSTAKAYIIKKIGGTLSYA